MKVTELNAINAALVDMSGKEGHGLGYEINKNLHLTKKALTDWTDRLNEYKAEKYIKDESGKPEVFEVDGQQFNKFKEDETEEINEVFEKFSNESFELPLVEFDGDKIKEAFLAGKFDGVDLSALYGVLID